MGRILLGSSGGATHEVSRVFLKRLPNGPETLISAQSRFSVAVTSDIAIIVEWGAATYHTLTLATVMPESGTAGGRTRVGSDAVSVDAWDGVKEKGSFERGKTMTAIALPDNGYRFAGWYSDSGFTSLVSEDAVYSSAMGNADTTLYAKFERESIALYKWEGGEMLKRLRWRSKVYALSKPANLTSVRVDATGYPVARFKAQSFSSPDAEATSTVDFSTVGSQIASQTMRRLPARRPERYFQVEIENNAEVDEIIIGTSGEGLAQ